MRYTTPTGFKMALEARLQQESLATGRPLQRLRQLVVFERFLAGKSFGACFQVDAALAEPQVMSPERISVPTFLQFAGVDASTQPTSGSISSRCTSPRNCTPSPCSGPARTAA